jgi:class 3 adenylate cyclase
MVMLMLVTKVSMFYQRWQIEKEIKIGYIASSRLKKSQNYSTDL